MVDKGWTGQTAAAAGVAAGTGAAQLGLGYGLGVVVWPTEATTDAIWLGSLGWATWIAATSAVLGAVAARRLHAGTYRGWGTVKRRGPWRFALAAAAAVGALLTVALIAVPARAAVRADTSAPQVIAAGYAVVGVMLGLIMAYWAVVSRPVAANIVATVGWIWTLAVAALIQGLITGRTVDTTHLGGWQFTGPGDGFRYGTVYWPGAVLTLVMAFVIGVLAARSAARRSDHGIGAAASGAAGPLLVAAAFFVLAPQLTSAVGQLQSAYLMAPYAVLAGLAGSAATVAAGQRLAARTGTPASSATGTAAYPLGAAPSETPVPGPPGSGPAGSGPAGSGPAGSGPAGSGPAASTASGPADGVVAGAGDGDARGSGAGARPVAIAADDPVASPAPTPPSRSADRPATATGRAKLPKARAPEPVAPTDPTTSRDAPVVLPATSRTRARSTVTAPPAKPVVARINPARDDADRDETGPDRTASIGGTVPDRTAPVDRTGPNRTDSEGPTPHGADPARSEPARNEPHQEGPTKTTASNTGASNTRPAGASSAGSGLAGSRSAGSRSAGSRSANSGPAGTGSAGSGSSGSGAEDVADQHRSDGGPDEGGKRRPGSARAKPATKSPTSGPTASRDIAPLWVDDGPPEPTVDRDESGKDG